MERKRRISVKETRLLDKKKKLSEKKEKLVVIAKLAEQAGRYDGKPVSLRNWCFFNDQLRIYAALFENYMPIHVHLNQNSDHEILSVM